MSQNLLKHIYNFFTKIGLFILILVILFIILVIFLPNFVFIPLLFLANLFSEAFDFSYGINIYKIMEVFKALVITSLITLPFVFLCQVFNEQDVYTNVFLFFKAFKATLNKWLNWIKLHWVFLSKMAIIFTASYLNIAVLNSNTFRNVDVINLILSISQILIINLMAILVMIAVSNSKKN